MTQNLFAACRTSQGGLVAKWVRLESTVQGQVEQLFRKQEAIFKKGITDETAFDGSWKPDDDEFLTIDVPDEASIFADAAVANASSLDSIDPANFQNEGIKALFTGYTENGQTHVLVQRFTSGQVLERKFALLCQNNVFRRLKDSAFTLDTGLTCVIEDGKVKFRSLAKLRSVLNMMDIYREATEPEVRGFAAHTKLSVADVDDFVGNTNQTTRKLIHAVMGNGVLDDHPVADIQSAAAKTNLQIAIENGKIQMPTERSEIKKLLQFLNESRYSGPLTGQAYVTNSQRPVTQ